MVDRWTNPTTASLRGEDSRPLQQTFSSLSSYLEKLDNAITAAAASGVSSLSAGTGIGLSGGTGAVTVSNTGVTSLTAGTGIGLSSGTGVVTVSNTGVTSLAGTANQITVSSNTGSVTVTLPQNIIISGSTPTLELRETTSASNVDLFLGQSGTNGEGFRVRYESGTGHTRLTNIYAGNLYMGSNNSTPFCLDSNNIMYLSNGNNSYMQFGPNSTWGSYLRVGSTPNVVGGGIAQVISTNGNLHLDCGTGQDIYVNYYSGRPIRIHGFVEMNGQAISNAGYIQAGGTGITYNGSVSASNWFRSTTGTGWYNEAHAGGIWMYDNWLRVYNNKPFYCENEFRTGNVFSGNVGRSRGSYGAISVGGNGITNTWDGIEFASAQTYMVQGDQYSGSFRNNNAWNWLFSYSTLAIGSDERYKRNIQPLNAGLNFIENLNPISFLKLTENPDDEPETTESHYYYGFSAQNVRAALDAIGETRDVKIHDIGGPNMGLVACTEDAVYDRQYIGITEFIAPLVQAVKELSSRVKQLEEGAVAQ